MVEKYGLRRRRTAIFEGRLIREFQRKAHHYPATVPDLDDTLESLALMRHHGAPTRLLDWIYSFFRGRVLCVRRGQTNTPCVVYALDTRKCVRDAKRQLAAVLALSPDEVDNPEYDSPRVDSSSVIRFRGTLQDCLPERA
jgi:FRG domain